jgi:hypothetical protein
LRVELARGKFIRLGDAVDHQHAGERFEDLRGDVVALAHRTDNGLLDALDNMGG